jgi:hypothetical protein
MSGTNRADVRPGARASHEVPEGHLLRAAPTALFGVALVSLAALGVAASSEPRAPLFSYLVAFLFWTSLVVGTLFFVLVQHVARAGWSVVLRRTAENLIGAAPVLIALLVPVVLGVRHVYDWADGARAAADPALAHKRALLEPAAFGARALLVVGVWSVIGVFLRRVSVAQDATGDPALTRRLWAVSGPSLVAYGLTVTLAAFDWVMSIAPHWASTIFGIYFFTGCVVASLAFLVVATAALRRAGLLSGLVTAEHFHDLGKLLHGFVAFWAYIAFSQYFLIWYANIPEETVWFAARWTGSWRLASLLLGAGHFALPLLLLLPRAVKRNAALLVAVSCWVLAMHHVDLVWLVMPALDPGGVRVRWTDAAALVGVGGVVLGAAAWLTVRASVVARGDPRLTESIEIENA